MSGLHTCFGDPCVVLAYTPSHSLFGGLLPVDWRVPWSGLSTSELWDGRWAVEGGVVVAVTGDSSETEPAEKAELPLLLRLLVLPAAWYPANSVSSSRTREVNRWISL
jgi:hypothetical protein